MVDTTIHDVTGCTIHTKTWIRADGSKYLSQTLVVMTDKCESRVTLFRKEDSLEPMVPVNQEHVKEINL